MSELVDSWKTRVENVGKKSKKKSDIDKHKLGLVEKYDKLKKLTKGIKDMKVEADHIPPICVFKKAYGNHFYRVAKWHHDHKDDKLKEAVNRSLNSTIEKIINGQDVTEDDYKIFKQIIDTLRQEDARENENSSGQEDAKENENSSGQEDAKENENSSEQEDAKENENSSGLEDAKENGISTEVEKKKAIELCIKKNEYEKMILEKMSIETDQNIKTKLKNLEDWINKKENYEKQKKIKEEELRKCFEEEQERINKLSLTKTQKKNIMKKFRETKTREMDIVTEEEKLLYDLICESGDNGACRNVLISHHKQGLTHGNSACSQAISAILQRALLYGDGEKLIKWSLMAANPVVSKCIKQQIKEKFPRLTMNISEEETVPVSDDATMIYHHIGDELLVEYYSKFITEKEKSNLTEWLKKKETLPNRMDGVLYQEILNELIKEIQHKTKGQGRPAVRNTIHSH